MHICLNSTCCAFKENVVFEVGQKVWCAIYGAGQPLVRQDVLAAEAKAKKKGEKQ